MGEIHVPLIFWKPGLIPASASVATPVSTTDLPATILDLVAPGDMLRMPGRSLAALWHSGEPVPEWPEPISELARLHWFAKGAPNYNLPVQSIVTPQWQYIHQQDKDFLFDWKTDPHETIDLCSAKPIVCSELKARSQATRESRTQEHDHMDLSSASKAGQVRLPTAPPQSVVWKKWS
jgi:arylsulfatase A-like enzyme